MSVGTLLLVPMALAAPEGKAPVFVRVIGASGLLGTLNNPLGVAVSPSSDSRIYVVDSGNARVQVFNESGGVIGAWGERGTADDQFWYPTDIAVSPDGRRAYVVDQRHRRVQVFVPSDACLEGAAPCLDLWWGGWGDGPGQFQDPTGIAVDGSGRVYVADWSAHVVQMFGRDGSYIRTLGRPGRDRDSLFRPTDVEAAPSGEIWVADRDNHRIAKFDPETGQYTGEFNYAQMLHYPTGIAIGPNGSFVVMDYDATYGKSRIRLFDAQEHLLRVEERGGNGHLVRHPIQGAAVQSDGAVVVTPMGASDYNMLRVPVEGGIVPLAPRGHALQQFARPRAVALDSHFLVVADEQNNRVLVIDPADDDLPIAVLGDINPTFRFGSLEGVAVHRSGPGRDDAVIYIADSGRNLVHRATPRGVQLPAWGDGDEARGFLAFDQPVDVAVGANGDVYIADSGNDRIVRRAADGQMLGILGKPGQGPGDLTAPSAVRVGPDGNIYVLEATLSRLQAFSPEGELVREWPGSVTRVTDPGRLWQPVALAADDQYIYVLENESAANGALEHVRVQIFRPSTVEPLESALVGVFSDRMGVGPGELWDPQGLAASPDGWIAIADTGNNRVQLFHWNPELVVTPTHTPEPPTATPIPTETLAPTEPPPSATESPPTATDKPTSDPSSEVPTTATATLSTPSGERQPTPVRRSQVYLPFVIR